MLEPLGQSQVLAYLKHLSSHYDISLISFEKPSDFADEKEVARIRGDCEAKGIRWLPQQFHHRPRLLASAVDTLTMLLVTFRKFGVVKQVSSMPEAIFRLRLRCSSDV